MNLYQSIEKVKEYLTLAKKFKLKAEEKQKGALELAALILQIAEEIKSTEESKLQKRRARIIENKNAKFFITQLTDQFFRSSSGTRQHNQLNYLIEKYGIPSSFSTGDKLKLKAFKSLGHIIKELSIKEAGKAIFKEIGPLILTGDSGDIGKNLKKLAGKGIIPNINNLGEAILSEDHAQKQLQHYIEVLKKPDVPSVSVKLSSIYSQLTPLSYKGSKPLIISRLNSLYEVAGKHHYITPKGNNIHKLVYLDMENYEDMHPTIDAFKESLSQENNKNISAGIVLQAYIPESFTELQSLTEWAIKRVENGGAPIRVRIVKGANLATEQIVSDLNDWDYPIFANKLEVDANFKKMIGYACRTKNAHACNIGIGTHNVFDIAYSLLERAETNAEDYISFEMLHGMAEPLRKTLQILNDNVLVYCPTAKKENLHNAMAYLIRRLDENTSPDNYLTHSFGLSPGTPGWEEETQRFIEACNKIQDLDNKSRKIQSRIHPIPIENPDNEFKNNATTDFSIQENITWAESIIQEWQDKDIPEIPLQSLPTKESIIKENPSNPNKPNYRYQTPSIEAIELALSTATSAKDQELLPQQRQSILKNAADHINNNRHHLTGAIIRDTGKILSEADKEVSETIDFLNYYAHQISEFYTHTHLQKKAKGPTLVISPWNFPAAIPTGGIAAAIATGNPVLLKPSSESVLVAHELCKLLWESGVPQNWLQLLPIPTGPVLETLIKDNRLETIILTGGTQTAINIATQRPDINLLAETGGKNTMILSALSDRESAIKDILESAFSHAGQKCSALSLLICEAEVYDDKEFLATLKSACESLKVGSPWQLDTKIGPLIYPAKNNLLKGLTELEPGEEWLVKPKQNPENPNLWSPGIKIGLTENSFTTRTEFFGPVLGIMRVTTFKDAIESANSTPYGLSAGLQSLDFREHKKWQNELTAGNYYINKPITGAIVGRHPFGGHKGSSIGPTFKTGGPNYMNALVDIAETSPDPNINSETLSQFPKPIINLFSGTEKQLWQSSLISYKKSTRYLKTPKKTQEKLGEDNHYFLSPRTTLIIKLSSTDTKLTQARLIIAAKLSGSNVQISCPENYLQLEKNELATLKSSKNLIIETQEELAKRLTAFADITIRSALPPDADFIKACAQKGIPIFTSNPTSHGELECLYHLRESTLSTTTHRYGSPIKPE